MNIISSLTHLMNLSAPETIKYRSPTRVSFQDMKETRVDNLVLSPSNDSNVFDQSAGNLSLSLQFCCC